jgi:hypothetical protein
MRTPDMSDEELDALFQRGAENYPDEHNLSAWLQMERKLEEAAVQQLVRQRVLRIFALETLVLLVALLSWVSYTWPTQAGKVAARVLTSPATAQTKLNLATTAQRTAANRSTAGATRRPGLSRPLAAQLPAPDRATPLTAPEPAVIAAPGGSRPASPARRPSAVFLPLLPTRKSPASTAGDVPATGFSASAGSIATAAPTNRPTAAIKPGGKPAATVAVASTADKPENTSPESAANSARTFPSIPVLVSSTPPPTATNETVAPEAVVAAAVPPSSEPLGGGTSGATLADSVTAPTSTPVVAAPVPEPAAVAAPTDSVRKKAPVAKPAYRFSLGLLYSPEVSTVRWARPSSVGSNLGVTVEYYFTSRLRLNVAALRSVKRYAARGSDYHPPADYWTKDYTIDKIDATCHITDLPINLRYDVLHHPDHAVFASVGLSTLLMRNERYIYAYQHYGKPETRDWSLANGSNHILSVLNLSAGYEHNLAGRWLLQGEPFVKIPLGGVGFGKVRLSSAGVFFSLKYRLLPTGSGPDTP